MKPNTIKGTADRADFWDEVCGSDIFNRLNLKTINRQSLAVFDSWYFNYYPYLDKYLLPERIENKTVLEIGLGFGTVGQRLFSSAKRYIGLDYANNPVKMMRDRITWEGKARSAKAVRGSALDLPFKDHTFDFVVSIGCLHHTGDTERSIHEIHRVLKHDGTAVVMLYNKYSYKTMLINPIRYFFQKIIARTRYKNYREYERATFDADTSGTAAPVVDLSSKADILNMFKMFTSVRIHRENCNLEPIVPRKTLLNNIGRIWGKDSYIIARK